MIEKTNEISTIPYHGIEIPDIPYAYQPIYGLKSNELFGYEALMRPPNISPIDYIEQYNKSKKLHVLELMSFVLGIEGYISRCYKEKLFINSFPNIVLSNEELKYLEKDYNKIMPDVVLEFLEYPELNQESWLIKKGYIDNNNIMLALDDFGAGINDISMFIYLSPNIVKFDRCLLIRAGTSDGMKEMYRRMVDLIHKQGSRVLAEGIETADELEFLKAIHVDLGQGYYLGRPE